MLNSRLDGVPIYAQRDDVIPAPLYNLWRRARMRFGAPIHIRMACLKEMELYLEHTAWVVVDRNRAEVPVIAWTAFAPAPERGIHEPVPCKLNYYHYMASGIRARVLECMQDGLERRLKFPQA